MSSNQIKNHLKELCLIPGLSGYEDNVRKYLQHQLNSINLKNTTDILGNLICTLPGNDNCPSVMFVCSYGSTWFYCKKNRRGRFY